MNALTGPVPASLGNLANLSGLSLGYNNLTGPIPATLGNLANLTSLSLHGNSLQGPVPATLGDLARLTSLSLHGNHLTGPLPFEMTKLSALTDLAIGGNSGLCAPADAAFQDWLAGLRYFSGRTCTAVPALPPAGVTGLALLLIAGRVCYGRMRSSSVRFRRWS